MATMKEDAVYTARQVEILIFGNYGRRMKIRLFTDSEATLESIASPRKVDRKILRMTVVDLKERLLDGDIYSYSWLPTENMWADMLTREKRMPPALENIIVKNIMDLHNPLMNEVKTIGTEICLANIRNR